MAKHFKIELTDYEIDVLLDKYKIIIMNDEWSSPAAKEYAVTRYNKLKELKKDKR